MRSNGSLGDYYSYAQPRLGISNWLKLSILVENGLSVDLPGDRELRSSAEAGQSAQSEGERGRANASQGGFLFAYTFTNYLLARGVLTLVQASFLLSRPVL